MGKGASTTTKSSVPNWLETPIKGLTSQITAAGAVDPLSRIAGTNPLLDSAQASLLGGPSQQFSDLLAKASGGAGSVGHYKTSDFMKDYQDPFLQQVVDTTKADLEANAGRVRAQQDLQLAGSPFRGSGSSITKALTEGELSRGMGSILAGLRSDAFSTAAGLGSADAGRFTQADQANVQAQEAAASRLAGLAGLVGNMDNQRTAQQFAYGDYLRGIENERLNADYTNLGKQSALLTPFGQLFQTQTSKNKPGTLDYISTGLGIASLFSDERLKTDIQRVGTRPDGLGVYLYRYLWSPVLHLGVMAQEVLKVKPDAVHVHPSGFLMVDYGRI